MNIHTSLMVGTTLLVVASLLFGLPLLRLFKGQVRAQRRKRMNIVVAARITHIQVKANVLTSGWQITATWTVPQTGQLLTFRSPLLALRPPLKVGDRVLVFYETSHPSSYDFELE